MDRFEGTCRLDWWSNSSTLLGSIEVAVVITTSESNTWDCQADLSDADDETYEAFTFLCDLDPVFTMRFTDGSTVPVTAHPTDHQRRFSLTEYLGSAHRPINHRIDL